MIDKKEKEYQEFGAFLVDYVRDLNHLSEDGWAVLVEGPRDLRALRKLGFRGELVTVRQLAKQGARSVGAKKVVILTDLDREGAYLASRCVRLLSQFGLKGSLAERRRLKRASRRVFLHVENLVRFAGASFTDHGIETGVGLEQARMGQREDGRSGKT